MKKRILMITAVVMLIGAIAIPTFAFGGFGFGAGRGVGPGMAGTVNVEDLEAWVQDQVEDGWMTQKEADYMLLRHKLRVQDVTEEEYAATVDEMVKDGWITEKEAAYYKENFAQYQEWQANNPELAQQAPTGYYCPMFGGQTNAPYVNNRMGGHFGGGRMGSRGPRW